MKRFIALALALAALALPPAASASGPWQYVPNYSWSGQNTMCQRLQQYRPSRGGWWPGCRIAVRETNNNETSLLSVGSSGVPPLATVPQALRRITPRRPGPMVDGTAATCSGSVCVLDASMDWVGMLNSWSVNIDIRKRTAFPVAPGAPYSVLVDCQPGGGWGTSVTVDFCGTLGTSSDGGRSVGARFRVTFEGPLDIPSITICQILYRFVNGSAVNEGEEAGPILYGSC